MTSNVVLAARSLIPLSTIENTVINDHTVNLVVYKSFVPWGTTMGLQEFLSGDLDSSGSVSTSSSSSATAAASKEVHRDTPTTTLGPGVPALTTIGSVGRVAPELVPITPTPTPTTASSEISITAMPPPASSHDGSISVNISNNLNNPGSRSPNPVVIVGIVVGIVISLILLALLSFLLFRRRRRATSSHHYPSPPDHPIPMLTIPRPVEPHSELPWPGLPHPEYFAPPKRTDGEAEYPHQLPKRPRMSGETFTEEERVGHAY